MKFDKFLDAADADGYHQQAQILVSTIGKNADGSVVRPAIGTYTLGTQNADGGVSSPGPANNNKDDGSCAGCFTVATGPIVAGVTPANVSPGSNVS